MTNQHIQSVHSNSGCTRKKWSTFPCTMEQTKKIMSASSNYYRSYRPERCTIFGSIFGHHISAEHFSTTSCGGSYPFKDHAPCSNKPWRELHDSPILARDDSCDEQEDTKCYCPCWPLTLFYDQVGSLHAHCERTAWALHAHCGGHRMRTACGADTMKPSQGGREETPMHLCRGHKGLHILGDWWPWPSVICCCVSVLEDGGSLLGK